MILLSDISKSDLKSKMKVFKNYQINLGVPFQVRVPIAESPYDDGEFEGTYGGAADGMPGGLSGGAAGHGDVGGSGGGIGGGGGFGAAGDGVGGGAALTDGAFDPFLNYDGPEGILDFYGNPIPNSGESLHNSKNVGGNAGVVSGNEKENGSQGEKNLRGGDGTTVLNAREEAEMIVGTARAEASGLVINAEEEAARIVEAARREAFNLKAKELESAKREADELKRRALHDGAEQGRTEGRKEYESLIKEAEGIREDAWQSYNTLLNGAEGDALELILDIAKKVVGEEFVYNRQNLLMLIADAFRHCTNKERVTLRISPDDYDYVAANKDILMSMIEGLGKLEIVRDLSLGMGSCYVETPFGSIDAGAKTRLAKVSDAFRKVLGGKKKLSEIA